ncbi:MAG: hypothetical protein J6Z25_02210 [Opitutales bacterium]|nr:hypothetical protein [Opitutales bacterium]
MGMISEIGKQQKKPKHSKSKAGFSLVEITLVISLMALLAGVFLSIPGKWKQIFSPQKQPITILQEALQWSRLWCAREHQPATVRFSPQELTVINAQGKTVQSFPWPISSQSSTALSYKVLPGILSDKGTFQPDTQAKSIDAINIQAHGFFTSTFVELHSNHGRETYAIDILTGRCQPFSW